MEDLVMVEGVYQEAILVNEASVLNLLPMAHSKEYSVSSFLPFWFPLA